MARRKPKSDRAAKKRQAASRLTSGGKLKKGEEKAKAKRARAAQKLNREIKEGKTEMPLDPNYMAIRAAEGSYGSRKIAPHAQGRKSSVRLTEVPEKYRDERGMVSYNPQSIRAAFKNEDKEQAIKAMRKEYTRLRSAAVKRLNRLEGAGFGGSQISKYYKDKMPNLRGMSRSEINASITEMLVDVNRFLASDLSTVKGQTELRNQRILTLREYGYDVDWTNFEYLTDVLDYIRDEYQDLFFDSDQLIEEAIKYINEVINDPELMKKLEESGEEPGKFLGDEVYERYSASSAELRSLSDL